LINLDHISQQFMKTNQRPHLGGRRANSSRSQRI